MPPPATNNVRSLSELVTDILESSVASIDIVVASSVKPKLASMSIPPAVALISIALAPVPAEFTDNT